jgi:hypothetical protein
MAQTSLSVKGAFVADELAFVPRLPANVRTGFSISSSSLVEARDYGVRGKAPGKSQRSRSDPLPTVALFGSRLSGDLSPR